ncbi:Flavin-linked sulfhydryl oxidase of the mitochondrial IMS [Polyrhizophydium stewartii]|uniref:Sulfhydryl oxidase n=1 Tax=Polyrhizophydium stewartii TaxID=2732419 RepID=A0ABR4MW60_9FUNG|nr:hypothetical protein HK105_005989 [Polyrhizophydium stewartii]
MPAASEPTSAGCNVCTDFRALRKKHRQETKAAEAAPGTSAGSGSAGAAAGVAAGAMAAASLATASAEPMPCPPDSTELGASTWTFLHTMAAYYPEKPTPEDRQAMTSFIGALGRFYPCWYCASHFRDFTKANPPDLGSNLALSRWFCVAHNEVNERLGKPAFDCSRVLERWRTGRKECFE